MNNLDNNLDDNLKKYIKHEHNIVRGDMALVRSYRNGREMSSVYYKDVPQPIHYGYNMRRREKQREITSEEIRTENNIKIKDAPSKGTGGQLAYVKLMTKERDSIKGLSIAASSILLHMCMGGIQWNTGKLMQERSKKPHTSETISKIISTGLRTAKKALKELSDREIVKYDKKTKAYFMSADVARKGVVIKNENKI